MDKIRPVARDKPISEAGLNIAQTANAVTRLERALDKQRFPDAELTESVVNVRWKVADVLHLVKRLGLRVDDQAREIRLLKKVVKQAEEAGAYRTGDP